MKIEGGTIIFKSAPEFFQKEQNGSKPNTVRILSRVEEEELYKAKDQLKTIRIVSTETGHGFERRIRDISPVVLSENCRVFTISWHHFSFYNLEMEAKNE